MRRIPARTAAISAFVLTLLAAAPVAAAASKQDLAWGTATRAPRNGDSSAPSFQFNAASSADGSGSAGTFIVTTPTGEFDATVTCLNVHGRTATISGRINVAYGVFDGLQGGWFVQVIQDNGTATRKHPSPDTMSTNLAQSEAEWTADGYTAFADICRDGVNALVNGGA
ncbi:MAG TPA: hypothetical protein VF484_03515, partial [Candidatus Limnocylindrales bacterium]